MGEIVKFKRALCLPGGGSKGAFQVGALAYMAEKGITFDCVAGVSVGSLNGAMVAQNNIQGLIDIWSKLTEKDVYKKPSWFNIIWNNLFKQKRSLYDASALRDTIAKHIDLSRIEIPFYIGVTSLEEGKYYSLSQDDFDTNDDFLDGIYASSLMPILWEPVHVKTKSGIISQAVDGGVRNVSPLKDVLKELPDHIYIIPCTDGVVEPKHVNNIIMAAERTFLDIMLNEVVLNDMKGLLRMNDLVLQANRNGYVLTNSAGKAYKYFGVTIIQPDRNIGSSTDFSREHLDSLFKLGYEAAKANI